MRLAPLSELDAEEARLWRNARLDALRTPYPLTKEQQLDWHYTHTGKWWSIEEGNALVGYGGIQHIQWESRIGELSLLMHPKETARRGAALDLILCEAFLTMNLTIIYAEVYECNRDAVWWSLEAKRRGAIEVELPTRKFYQGQYWDSVYYSFDRDAYASIDNVS